jgi:hypothetical protein
VARIKLPRSHQTTQAFPHLRCLTFPTSVTSNYRRLLLNTDFFLLLCAGKNMIHTISKALNVHSLLYYAVSPIRGTSSGHFCISIDPTPILRLPCLKHFCLSLPEACASSCTVQSEFSYSQHRISRRLS